MRKGRRDKLVYAVEQNKNGWSVVRYDLEKGTQGTVSTYPSEQAAHLQAQEFNRRGKLT